MSTSPPGPRTPSGPRPTWFVLTAIVLIALNLRTAIMGFVPVLDVIGVDLGFDAVAVGLLATVPTAVFGLVAFAGPPLIRRMSGEGVLALASAATFVGITLRSFAMDAWQLGGAFIVAVAGIGLANVVLVPVIKQYYAHRLGLVNGLYLGVMQIGPIIAPIIAAAMIEGGAGWRFATGMWAVLAAIAAVAWGAQWWIARRGHRELAAARADRGGHVDPDPHIPFSLLFRSPLAWGIMLVFSMNSLSTYTLLSLLPARYVDAGESLTFATAMLGVLPVIAVAGSFLVPSVTARVRNPFWLIVSMGVAMLAGTAGVLWVPTVWPVVWVVLLGYGLLCFPLALTLMNLRSRTRAGAAGLSGFGQGVGYLIASVGPIGIGLARSATDGWLVPFGLIALTVPVSIVAGWFATRRHMIEDEVGERA